MDISNLVRSPETVKASLKRVGESIYATKPTKIYIPVRFRERNLAFVGVKTYIVGIFAIVLEDKLMATHIMDAMVQIEPTSFKIVSIDDSDYYEFFFEPGAKVVVSTNIVRRDTLVYQIYNEIISKGRVPWYMNYLDLARIFDTARKYANANVGAQREVTELIVSLISRNETDRSKYYRTSVKDIGDVYKKPPAYVPLKSVLYAATNTLNKIAGSYMSDGLISALVNPSTRVENIERVLRT